MIAAFLNLTGLDGEGESAVRPAVSHIVAVNTDEDGDTFIDVPGHRYFVTESAEEVFEQLFELIQTINGLELEE